MPTFIEQFADAEIKVRYKEPLLTGGLDQMLTGITPQGIHRGFRLATNVANLTVTVQADPADNDHIAAYTTDDGYTLRLRRTGGDFNLDLSPFVSTTVVIAIFAEYANGVTTFAEIRAYELDPVDEFTGAAERGELVVLGTVVVPASGVIPEADIDPTYRTLAWDHVGSDAAEWEQVVENGSFELAADDTSFVAADRGFVPHWDTQYIPTQHTWSIDSSNPYVGNYALKVTGTGVAPPLGSVIPTDRIIAVQPGQLIRASFWVRGENWPTIGPAGTMGIQLNFYGHQLSLLAFRVAQDKSLSGTFGWTRVDEYIEVPFTPSGIEWCVPSIVVLDSPTPATVTDSLVFDDVRIWVEKGPPTLPISSVQDGLTNGGQVLGQLGIAEANVTQFGITQNLDSFVKGILSLHKLDNLFGVNRYRWSRLDDEPFNLLMSEGSIQLTGFIGTEEEAELPRLAMDTAPSATSNYTHLLQALPQTLGWAGARIYSALWGPGATSALLIVLNAWWDQSLFSGFGGWNLDDSTEHATLLYVANDGVLELYQYDQSGGTPFDIFGWDRVFGVDGFDSDNNLIEGPLVPRAWARFQAGLGAVTVHKEEGIASIVVNGGDSRILDITLDDHVEGGYICAVGTSFFTSHIVNLAETGTNTLEMRGYSAAGVSQIDFAGAVSNYSIVVLGREA